MGYRSIVALAIDKTELADQILQTPGLKPALQNATTITDKSTYMVYTFVNWKWYSTYPEIHIIEQAIANIETSENFGFMRIGEDYTDVECLGNPEEFDIYLSRTIVIDGEEV